jgi:hypothetical protein
VWHIGGYILDRSVKNNKKTRTNTLSSKKHEKVIKSIGKSPSFVIHLSSKKKRPFSQSAGWKHVTWLQFPIQLFYNPWCYFQDNVYITAVNWYIYDVWKNWWRCYFWLRASGFPLYRTIRCTYKYPYLDF